MNIKKNSNAPRLLFFIKTLAQLLVDQWKRLREVALYKKKVLYKRNYG